MINKKSLIHTYEFFTDEGNYRKQYHQNLCFALGYKLEERIVLDLNCFGFDTGKEQIISQMTKAGFIVGITGFDYIPSVRVKNNQFPDDVKQIPSYVLNMDKFELFFNGVSKFRDLEQELTHDQLNNLYDWVKWCANHHQRNVVAYQCSITLKELIGLNYKNFAQSAGTKTGEVIYYGAPELLKRPIELFNIDDDQFKQAMLDCNVKVKRNRFDDNWNIGGWRFAGGFN